MPLSASDRRRYPANWEVLRAIVLERAHHRCEGSRFYPLCRAKNYGPHPATGSIVILTIAHLDHCPENAALANLRALCQRCHLTYDRRTRLARREPMLFQDI